MKKVLCAPKEKSMLYRMAMLYCSALMYKIDYKMKEGYLG